MTELTQEELKALAELAGKKNIGDDVDGDVLFSMDGIIGHKWQPHKDPNQFEEVLFAVAERYGIETYLHIYPKTKLGDEVEHDVMNREGDCISLDGPIDMVKQTYKAEVCKAILEACGK
jgi:hypothetical protein